MKSILPPPMQGLFVGMAVLMMQFVTACAGAESTSGQPAAGATATKPSVSPTPSVAFKAGGISFVGPVKSSTGSSLVLSTPDGQTFTVAITTRTDRSAYGGHMPNVGSTVDMESAANADGSFTATLLKPFQSGDADPNVMAYTGITTSAVGADRVLHMTVGIKSYTFTIPDKADLNDFGGKAQNIGNNVSVEVKVQFPANAVVSVGNPAAK